MNYISAIERYHEYQAAIHELMASIVTGIFDARLFQNEDELETTIKCLIKNYPFIDLIFTLDGNGIQTSRNITPMLGHDVARKKSGLGANRQHRPYFRKAFESEGVIVTEPYLSTSSHNLCISSALRCLDENGDVLGILVVDIDLSKSIEFLMGDSKRKKFQPLFMIVYSLIVTGLFTVVGLLLFFAASEIAELFQQPQVDDLRLKPFSIIIYLTLAFAIFDLGKTTLEEEVLMHKDIFRHSSTRRTITRFIGAILIAVSIEALLLMFKSVMGSPEYLYSAVTMMMASVGLLVGLGIYVYLGAKAESTLTQLKKGL